MTTPMTVQSKPCVFISPTIYDFRDLRSALKYWLESLGYEVLLSEFNDFTKPLDENSYKACLQAIERVNHFILLIGARVGGPYNKSERISITRMEYRTAYDLMKAGKLKLITFVREDVWNVREDRKALKDFLIYDHKVEREINDSDLSTIINHKSNLVTDAEAVFEFLKEVARLDEMKKATEGIGDFPVGNWIHRFSTFEEIIEALQSEFRFSDSIARIALKENLKRELLSNLTALTFKDKDCKMRLHLEYASEARKHYKGDLLSTCTIPGRALARMTLFVLFGVGPAPKLSTQFIDQALSSGEFLEYDFELNRFHSGLFNNALFQLKESINQLRGFWQFFDANRTMSFVEKYKRYMETEDNVTVDNVDLYAPFTIYDWEDNIASVSIALIKSITGDDKYLALASARPSSPLEDEAHKIEKSRVSIEEISDWIASI